MAEETIQIIRIETGEAVKSVNDLRENIKTLKERLGDLDIGSKEYQETLEELKQNQNAVKDAMYATSSSFEDVQKAALGANSAFDEQNKLINAENVSYNELVHTMARLKEAWRSTTDAQERSGLSERINSVNDRLKGLDKSIGNNQRNVGNYASALDDFSTKFRSVAGAAGGVIAPITGVTSAMKAMSATPVIGILGILANLIGKVMSSMDQAEETTASLTKAFSGFSAISDLVTKGLQVLGNGIAFIVSGFSSLASAIFGVSEKQKERVRITEQELELAQQQRETTVLNAEAERDAAKLKAEAAEKDKHTTAERIALLEEAAKKENDIAMRAMEDAKLAYEIQKAKNALTASSAEEKQREADAYAALVKAETNYYNKVKESNSQIAEARKKMAEEGKKAARERQDALKSQISAEKALIEQEIELAVKGSDEELALQKEKLAKELLIAQGDAKLRIKDKDTLAKTLANLQKKYNRDEEKLEREHQKTLESIRVQGLKNIANKYEQGSLEYLKAMAAVRKQELDDIQREEGETMESYNARRLAAQKQYYDSLRALNQGKIKESTAELRLAMAQNMGDQEAQYAGLLALAENYYNNLQRLEGESETEFAIRKEEANQAVKDAQKNLLDFMQDQERLSLENRRDSYLEGTLSFYKEDVNLKQWEYDQIVSIGKLETETEEEYNRRKLEAAKNLNDSKKRLLLEEIATMQNYAATTSSIISSIADIYEADEKNSEKNANKIKGLRIAAATIDTISGAVGAFMQAAATIPPPMGAIVGSIQAAAVTAAGVAQIAKIKSTKVSGSASNSALSAPAVTSAPVVTPDITQVRNITSASEEERLNQMASDQRVVLVMSDLEAKQNQSRVQMEESSF